MYLLNSLRSYWHATKLTVNSPALAGFACYVMIIQNLFFKTRWQDEFILTLPHGLRQFYRDREIRYYLAQALFDILGRQTIHYLLHRYRTIQIKPVFLIMFFCPGSNPRWHIVFICHVSNLWQFLTNWTKLRAFWSVFFWPDHPFAIVGCLSDGETAV